MTRSPAVICPVDFSDASRAALGHAAAIADHFGAELTVLAVLDPFVAALAWTARIPEAVLWIDDRARPAAHQCSCAHHAGIATRRAATVTTGRRDR